LEHIQMSSETQKKPQKRAGDVAERNPRMSTKTFHSCEEDV
jgi:hypothetical protein